MMQKRILVADDEPDIVEILQYNLEKENFDVITAFDGVETLEKLAENPDLILLDIMMPRLDGFGVFKKIKDMPEYMDIPIVFLTARSNEVDEITGLELGADDYIQKPISPKLLIARINTALRKSKIYREKKDIPDQIKTGPLVIDRLQYMVYIDGVETIFPRKEFEVLYYLANNPNIVHSRDSLLKDIWGTDVYVVDRTIDVHIRKIREKLGTHADLIETTKGVGYKFKSA